MNTYSAYLVMLHILVIAKVTIEKRKIERYFQLEMC